MTDPVVRHRPRAQWAFTAIGVLFLVCGAFGLRFTSMLSDVEKNDNSAFLPTSADSTKVANAADKFNSLELVPGFVVYQRAAGLTAADRAKVISDASALRRVPGVAAEQVGQPQFKATVAALSVPLVGKQDGVSRSGDQLVDAENAVVAAARANAPPGLAVHSAGASGILVAFIDSFAGIDGILLGAAGLVVIAILLVVYRSPVLWFFPLFSAVLALGGASLIVYPLAKSGTITLNGQSQGILSVLVIGAGTDYALLLVSRYREELHRHQRRTTAMVAAWRGAAPPIAASAVTVILGLLCLSFADLNSTRGLGPVCAVGIFATVLIMLTVLPVLLVISGRWIFWPRVPHVDRQNDLATHGAWGRAARGIVGHSRRNWALSALVLVACAVAISTLKVDGLSQADGFTNKPDAVVGQSIYDANFPKGAGVPADILTSADRADAVIAAVQRVPGVAQTPGSVCVEVDYAKLAAAIQGGSVSPSALATGCPPAAIQLQPVGGQLLVGATLTNSYDSPQAYATVRGIRSAVAAIPGAHALVGGSSATNLDIQDASRHDRNLIIPIVLVVILIVLALLLRALVAPILLILTVVLSFLATLGVSALFFNHVFDFANADPAFPLFAFVFLVALGIDYNIFLMTRIREETLRYGTREGVTRGLAVTGGVITSAGVVLAATFVVLGVLPIVFLAEVGFAVAFGVLLDTLLVRTVLVPALSYDIGRLIWWPSRLSRRDAARPPADDVPAVSG